MRLPGAPIAVDDELTGLCNFRSPITGTVYALGMTDAGQMLQWELFAAGRTLQGRLVRSVPLGMGVEYCVVDDANATMYYGDEALGVLSLPVEPETDAERKIFELVAPRGGIAEEIKGLALAQGADGNSLLFVSDVSAERLSSIWPGWHLEGPSPDRRRRSASMPSAKAKASRSRLRLSAPRIPRACSRSRTRTTTAPTAITSSSAGGKHAPR